MSATALFKVRSRAASLSARAARVDSTAAAASERAAARRRGRETRAELRRRGRETRAEQGTSHHGSRSVSRLSRVVVMVVSGSDSQFGDGSFAKLGGHPVEQRELRVIFPELALEGM